MFGNRPATAAALLTLFPSGMRYRQYLTARNNAHSPLAVTAPRNKLPRFPNR